jgi:aerobic carbon-monoxide dehydrogenase large subunit
VGFDDAGCIEGLDVDFLHDVGAYCQYGITLPLITATQLPGPYRLRNYRVAFQSLFTNTVPVTPYRGAGRPQAAYCMERTIDRIAAHLEKDRTEIRLANFVTAEEMPYDLGLIFQDGKPAIYDSGDFAKSLSTLKSLIGWDDFPAMRQEAASKGRRLGIGIGCYVEGTGLGPYEGSHVEVQTTGRVVVSIALSSQGQGHETVFAQIAAEELGVPVDRVDVVAGDTRRFSAGIGTYASRAAVMSGNAVAVAARAVRAKALRVAGEALEVDPQDLEIVDAFVRVRGSPDRGIPLNVVAVLSNPMRYAFTEEAKLATQFAMSSGAESPLKEGETPGLEAQGFYSPPHATFANGMHAAIVEVGPATAEIKILRYAVVHDCGRLISQMIVEGQIHGGVAQGIAGALYERMAYDDSGQLLNANFMDFLMPYATEIPHIEIAHLETPSPLNPLGIKGVGEAGVIPVAAVLAGAIEDAEGLPISKMPISPSELWQLRRSNGFTQL